MRANIRDKCDTIAKIQGLMKLLAETTQQTASVANGQPDEHTRQETATRATDILSTRVDTLKMTLDAILASAKENPRSRFYQMFWFAETDKENLKSIGQRIDTAMSNFKFQGGIEMRHTLGQIAADIKDRYLLEVEKEAREALKALNPANASYTSAQLEEKSRLQPGTRSTILRALAEWAVDGEPNQRVYILYGQAGLGKSSIAHAFCRQLPKDRLGASFFFLRGSGECSDVYRVFTTIAHQLAHSITALQSHIVKASRIHGGGTGQLLDHQFDTLILEPLRSLLDISDMPIILLVVDGVDECEKKPEGAVPDMLRLLLKVAQEIPFLRVLIATRPEPYIMDALNSCPHGNTIIWRDLQKEPDVDSDIRAFIDAEFSKCTTAGEFTLCEEHSDAAQTLTRLSDGLFIFASTIVKYLTQSRRLSAERYNVLLGAQSHLGSGNIYNKLDTLYVGIIGKSFEDIQGDSKHIAYVKQLLTWVALFHPFSENSEAVASAAGLETSGIPTSITLDFLDRLRLATQASPNSLPIPPDARIPPSSSTRRLGMP
ncbi:hypothetical protein CERSUDRAFT_136937 [Gelatoporia subvermispora B]|uniref:NACHT domain-containing protein n=1 Tax=Ceriporiopsis subvermispora (strain B) TaxID=914234 RepID=M2QI22_CERS8|nr:hypothetical protein CERSUDRAFT_136937 [Gelatoporia subvermispora B]